MAEILRGGYDIVSDSAGWHWLNGTLFGMSIMARSEDCIRNGLEELADLIDSDDAQSRDAAKMVDRDALLALADEMEHGAMPDCGYFGSGIDAELMGAVSRWVIDCARRIREALGEIDE